MMHHTKIVKKRRAKRSVMPAWAYMGSKADVDAAAAIVRYAFPWNETPQPQGYWLEVYTNLCDLAEVEMWTSEQRHVWEKVRSA